MPILRNASLLGFASLVISGRQLACCTKKKTLSFPPSFPTRVTCMVLIALAVINASAEDRYFDETKHTRTLFSFDSVSIPYFQNLKLEMRSPQKHPMNPVVARGPDGSADSWAVQFYGSVIRHPETGKFRVWYCAVSKTERAEKSIPSSGKWRVAYAESDDGISWTKPNLGLVSVNGSTENNLCKIEPHLGILNLKVLDEPDDPNPQHRYKMAAHVWTPKSETRRNGALAPFVSADGFTWKFVGDTVPIRANLPEADTVIPPLHIEPAGGLYKWDGLYHTSGQNAIAAERPYHGRVTRTSISADFVHWSQTSAIQTVRIAQHEQLGPGKSRMGEQTHEGISVWNRGDVLLGASGVWHGTAEWKDLTIDLGFVISNDGVHFREPMVEWTLIERGVDGEWDQGGLLQGQGFENIGEQTWIYYGAWDPRAWESSPPRGGIGLATLPRDRFADLIVDESTKGPGDYQMTETECQFITSSISVDAGKRPSFINAAGLSKDATLKIELLDHLMNPLDGYSTEIKSGGFQVPVKFGGQTLVTELPERIKVRATFQGKKRTDIRFNAMYIR
ncbi:MAG: hypothetical protein AB8B91_25480 [Rubripirellula sp.]